MELSRRLTLYKLDLLKKIAQEENEETAQIFKRKLKRFREQKAIRAVQEALGTYILEVQIQFTYEIEL